MRYLILALVLSACLPKPAPVAPQPPAPAPVAATPAPPPPTPPTNLVCSAFKGVNEAAKCDPVFTDLGELHVHVATVTLGQTQLACRTDLSMLGVLCSDPIVVKQQPPPPVEDKKPAKTEPKKK